LRAARYAVERDWRDAGYGSAGQNEAPVRPGRLLGAEAVPDGARFFFEQYELYIRLLAPNLFRIVWGAEAPASYAVVKTEWPEMVSRLQREPGECTVQGSGLKVLVGSDATVTVFAADGEVLREEAPPERRGAG